MKFIVTCFFILFCSLNLYSDFIDFYPDINALENYTLNLKNYLSTSNKKFFIIRKKNIFKTPEEILKYTQKNFINISIIPLKTLKKLDIDNNLLPLLKKASFLQFSSQSYSDLIPLRIELNKYGLFFFNILPGSKYFLFTSKKKLIPSKINLAVTNDFFLKKFKKLFPNTLYVNENPSKISNLLKSGIFNSIVISCIDYSLLNIKMDFAYNFNLSREKYCIIANLNYWKNLDEARKNQIWSFINKNDKIFLLDIKKEQDKILNNLKIKRMY